MRTSPPDRVLPAVVGWAHTGVSLPEALHPDEEAYLARAVERRRQQFTTVRACARVALGRLGKSRPPMVPGRAGYAAWPTGVVGSMTHAVGFCAAAAARTSDARSLGIDADSVEPLPDDVLALVASPAERTHLEVLATGPQVVPWDRLLFSAKESVYKAWYPVMRSGLGFEDVRLRIYPGGEFRAELLVRDRGAAATALVDAMRGRWCVTSDHLVSAVFVPPGDAPTRRPVGAEGPLGDRGPRTGVSGDPPGPVRLQRRPSSHSATHATR